MEIYKTKNASKYMEMELFLEFANNKKAIPYENGRIIQYI